MYRIKVNQQNSQDSREVIVTIGNFDGLHLGHLKLFERLNSLAASHNYHRVAITFEPLPLEYFSDLSGKARLTRLSLLRDKFIILKQHNLVDELVILHFNQTLANMGAEQFIRDILQQQLKVAHIVLGHDFKFGKSALGGKDNFIKNNIQVDEVPPFYIASQRVSSSLIRQYAANNQLGQVHKLLGRNISYTSRVIYGNQLGRKFNVPTINLSLGANRPALWGIYIAYVYIDNIRYEAVASIGKNPTVSVQDTYKLEAHLLGVDLDLYGKIAIIEILQFMREERRFDDLDSLFKQIHLDLQLARDYFNQ